MIGPAPYNSKERYWKVRCKCGYEGFRRAGHVRRGISTRCHKCRIRATRGPNSKYWKGGKFISGEFITKIKNSAKYRNKEFTISIVDLENQWSK